MSYHVPLDLLAYLISFGAAKAWISFIDCGQVGVSRVVCLADEVGQAEVQHLLEMMYGDPFKDLM
jgi:hypothetical protein